MQPTPRPLPYKGMWARSLACSRRPHRPPQKEAKQAPWGSCNLYRVGTHIGCILASPNVGRNAGRMLQIHPRNFLFSEGSIG